MWHSSVPDSTSGRLSDSWRKWLTLKNPLVTVTTTRFNTQKFYFHLPMGEERTIVSLYNKNGRLYNRPWLQSGKSESSHKSVSVNSEEAVKWLKRLVFDVWLRRTGLRSSQSIVKFYGEFGTRIGIFLYFGSIFTMVQSSNGYEVCDDAIFSADCCYDILQHLLHICMHTTVSVTFQAVLHPTSSTCRNLLRFQPYIQNVS